MAFLLGRGKNADEKNAALLPEKAPQGEPKYEAVTATDDVEKKAETGQSGEQKPEGQAGVQTPDADSQPIAEDGADNQNPLAGKLVENSGLPLAPPGQHTIDPMDVLGSMQEGKVRELGSAVEATTAITVKYEVEMPNKYAVLNKDGKMVFLAVETTDVLTRQSRGCCTCFCSTVDWSKWQADLRVLNEAGEAEEAFRLNRGGSLSCCCFGRPSVDVQDTRTGKPLLQLVGARNCCGGGYVALDPQGQELMRVKGDGCIHWGLLCPLPWGPCSRVIYNVHNKDVETVAHMTKRVPNMWTWLAAPDVDNYDMDLSFTTEPVEKLALMSLAVFLDFRKFSRNANAFDKDFDWIPNRFDFCG